MGCGASSSTRGGALAFALGDLASRPIRIGNEVLEPEPELEPEQELEQPEQQRRQQPGEELGPIEPEPEPEPHQLDVETAWPDEPEPEPVPPRVKPDPIERSFILMDGWEEGLSHRTEASQLQTFKGDSMYEHSWRPPPVRNVLGEWLEEIGLGHKQDLMNDRLYLNVWRQGLPLDFGGMPLDLEALISDRSVGYVHRRASGSLEPAAVEHFLRLMEFSAEEEQLFRNALSLLRQQPEDFEQSSIFGSPSTPSRKKKKKKKRKTAKSTGGKEMQRLGEDPEERRKAAERIQAMHRGKMGRREALEAKKKRKKQKKKAAAAAVERRINLDDEGAEESQAAAAAVGEGAGESDRKLTHSRHRNMQPMTGMTNREEHDAATKIQAVHRGKKQRIRSAKAKRQRQRQRGGGGGGRLKADSVKERQAAVRIQAAQRGKHGRRSAANHKDRMRAVREEKEWLMDRHEAATKIQKAQRSKLKKRKKKKNKKQLAVVQEILAPVEPVREPVDVAAFAAALAKFDADVEPKLAALEAERVGVIRVRREAEAAELGQQYEQVLAEEQAAQQKAVRDRKARAAKDRAVMLSKLHDVAEMDLDAFNGQRSSYLNQFEQTLAGYNALSDAMSVLPTIGDRQRHDELAVRPQSASKYPYMPLAVAARQQQQAEAWS